MRGNNKLTEPEAGDLPVGVMAPRDKGPTDFEILGFFPLQVQAPARLDQVVIGEVNILLPHVGATNQYACVIVLGGPTPLCEVGDAIKLAQRELYGLYLSLKDIHKKGQA